jgi:ABC-type nitrate/sulfonate/bicarbonate transport system substrate-binding protein
MALAYRWYNTAGMPASAARNDSAARGESSVGAARSAACMATEIWRGLDMMMGRISRLVGAVALMTVISAAARADEVTIKIATPETPPSMHNLYLQVAYERGFFEKHGIKVSQLMQLNGGPLATQAVSAGQADVTATDAEGIMQAAVAGYNVRAVSAPAQHLSYIIDVRKEITSFADLKGQPFAVSRAGALSQYLLFPMLDKAGVPRNSVQWLGVGGSTNRALALSADRVKGTLLYLENALDVQRDPNIKPLVRIADVLPNYPHELLLVRKDMIDKNPAAVTGITAAVMEACRYIMTHKEDTLKVFQKYSPDTDPKIAEGAYDALVSMKAFGVNGGMTQENLTTALTMAVENKLLEKPLPLDQWADFHFQAEALAQLGGPIAE